MTQQAVHEANAVAAEVSVVPVVQTGMLPAMPSPSESVQLISVADKLHESNLYPAIKNAAGMFAIVEYGRELGVGPMMALQNISMISGKPSAGGQLMLALAVSRGVRYQVLEESRTGCSILFERGGIKYTATFDEADAKAAGLLNKKNWQTFPKDMYFWRAVAKGVRRIAPEAIMGLYTPEELTNGELLVVENTDPAAAERVPPKADPKPPERSVDERRQVLLDSFDKGIKEVFDDDLGAAERFCEQSGLGPERDSWLIDELGPALTALAKLKV